MDDEIRILDVARFLNIKCILFANELYIGCHECRLEFSCVRIEWLEFLSLDIELGGLVFFRRAGLHFAHELKRVWLIHCSLHIAVKASFKIFHHDSTFEFRGIVVRWEVVEEASFVRRHIVISKIAAIFLNVGKHSVDCFEFDGESSSFLHFEVRVEAVWSSGRVMSLVVSAPVRGAAGF